MTKGFIDFAKRLAVLTIVALALGGIAWKVTETRAQAAAPANPGGPLYAERTMGNQNAPVKMVEYFSLTCPHCAHFYQDIFPKLKADYIDTGKVLFVSRDFPFDKPGIEAAELARCVPPDRYFPMVDLMFKGQQQWGLAPDTVAALKPLGKFAGLTDSQIDACFANKDLETFIVTEVQGAKDKYEVSSTPTFIFNDGADKIAGAVEYDKFKATIDALIAKKQ